jgi:hypothetical protein
VRRIRNAAAVEKKGINARMTSVAIKTLPISLESAGRQKIRQIAVPAPVSHSSRAFDHEISPRLGDKRGRGSNYELTPVPFSIAKLTPVPFWLVGSEKSEGRGGSEKREQSEQHERAKQRTKRHSRVRRKRKDQAGRCSQSSDPKQGGV